MHNVNIGGQLKAINIALWAIFVAVVAGFSGAIDAGKNIVFTVGSSALQEPLKALVMSAIIVAGVYATIVTGGLGRLAWLRIHQFEERTLRSKLHSTRADLARLMLALSIVAVPIAFGLLVQTIWKAIFPT